MRVPLQLSFRLAACSVPAAAENFLWLHTVAVCMISFFLFILTDLFFIDFGFDFAITAVLFNSSITFVFFFKHLFD